MAGLDSLPNPKWTQTGKQPILKNDFVNIETGILQAAVKNAAPTITWLDNTAVRVMATSDFPAQVAMSGFPNIYHPGTFCDFGLTDSKYRVNDSNVDMDFDTPSTFLGNEKASAWYAIFAVAGGVDSVFTLLGIPWMRVASQDSQTINLRNCLNSAGIGYGFTTNALAGYKLLMISGGSRGAVRTISANNNDNATGGTITYTGTALTVAQGDWFVVLPNTNFRFLGDIYNNASGHIEQFARIGGRCSWYNPGSYYSEITGATKEIVNFMPPLAVMADIVYLADTDADNILDTDITSYVCPYPGGTMPDLNGYSRGPRGPVDVRYCVINFTLGSGAQSWRAFCHNYEYPPGII